MLRRTILIIVACFALLGCEPSAAQVEHQQQEAGTQSLLQNQPVPDLGGWSFERHVVIETYKARNRTIATYTYTMTIDGKIIEICSSIGYPIPYSTQLTNPLQAYGASQGYTSIGNPEPNGLYSPDNAEGTIVNCVNPDGSVTPTYWEPRIFALPYRIKADVVIARADDKAPTFSVDPNGK